MTNSSNKVSFTPDQKRELIEQYAELLVDNIFEKLETAVDIHYAELDALCNTNPEPFIPTFHD